MPFESYETPMIKSKFSLIDICITYTIIGYYSDNGKNISDNRITVIEDIFYHKPIIHGRLN